MFKVHIGYTANGKDRWRKYDTLEAAKRACEAVFSKIGIVLTIVEEKNVSRGHRK